MLTCDLCGKNTFKVTYGLTLHMKNCKGRQETLETSTTGDLSPVVDVSVLSSMKKEPTVDEVIKLNELKDFSEKYWIDYYNNKATPEDFSLLKNMIEEVSSIKGYEIEAKFCGIPPF